GRETEDGGNNLIAVWADREGEDLLATGERDRGHVCDRAVRRERANRPAAVGEENFASRNVSLGLRQWQGVPDLRQLAGGGTSPTLGGPVLPNDGHDVVPHAGQVPARLERREQQFAAGRVGAGACGRAGRRPARMARADGLATAGHDGQYREDG